MSLALQQPFLQRQPSISVEQLMGFGCRAPPGTRPAVEMGAGLTSTSCCQNVAPVQSKVLWLRSIHLVHGFDHPFPTKILPHGQRPPKRIANYIPTECQLVLFLCSFRLVSSSLPHQLITMFMPCRVLLLNYVLCRTKL